MAGTASGVVSRRICMNWVRERKSFNVSCVAQKRTVTKDRHIKAFDPAIRAAMKRMETTPGRDETLCTNCAPNKLGHCGKLFKVNAGEVAERLNAAVC